MAARQDRCYKRGGGGRKRRWVEGEGYPVILKQTPEGTMIMASGTPALPIIDNLNKTIDMRGRHSGFKPRDCWICGKTMLSGDEVEFIVPGDCNGSCKSHNLKDVLKMDAAHRYDTFKGLATRRRGCPDWSIPKAKNIKIINKKPKTPNIMKRIIGNVFLAIVAWEVLVHLPHLINLLINKIK